MSTEPTTIPAEPEPSGPRLRVMWMSTFAFTVMFAVWLMLGVLGLKIKSDPRLLLGDAVDTMTAAEIKPAAEARFEWLLAVAILSGAIFRMNFGIWADQYGGRNMMVILIAICIVPTYWLSQATSYTELLICAGLFGLAGNSFSIGISWCSAWFPASSKGTALGVFGAGNVGASGTKLLIVLSPAILTMVPDGGMLGGWIPGGWRVIPAIYSVLLLVTLVAILLICPKIDRKPGQGRAMRDMLKPLGSLRVWRFSLYYVVVFGAYVALSAWLPSYYKNTYEVSDRQAALMTALFIFPASLLRPLGGYLSDRYGPRGVTYCVFIGMTVVIVPLCLPQSLLNFGPWTFTALMVAVGVGMGIGKASVYKYIPNYFPKDVGAVGGIVGLLGALGGFFLPKLFGILGRTTGTPQAAFYALLLLSLGSLVWLHLVVLKLKAEERIGRMAPAPIAEPEPKPA
jgi:MFS transporter, NNP family, nitrate/nitrite transporter